MAKEKKSDKKSAENKEGLRTFTFPKFGKVIEARSLKEANEKLQQYLNIKPKDNG